MVRAAFWLLVAFAVAVGVALLMQTNHGYVTVLWPPYRIEVSNNMAVVALALAFVLIYVLFRVLSRLVGAPRRYRGYRGRKAQQRTLQSLQGAMVAYCEGRYAQAEKLALQAQGATHAGGAASLIAARAAHRLGASERRDRYLQIASEQSDSQPAALQSRAEFALDEQRPEQAIDAFDQLAAEGGGSAQPVALSTALDAYRQSERWDLVMDTARQLARKPGAPLSELNSIRVQAYRQMLAPREGDAKAIREVWKSLSSEERKETDLAALTVGALARSGAHDDASRIALTVLDETYDASTVEAYGATREIPARVRLEQLERWRNSYGDRPKLLEMLGRICADERLWGKAEAYLLASIGAEDSVSARVALGQLCEATQRADDAGRQYRAAARLSLGEQQPTPAVQGRSAFGNAGMVGGGGVSGEASTVLLDDTEADAVGPSPPWSNSRSTSGSRASHVAPSSQAVPGAPSATPSLPPDLPAPASTAGTKGQNQHRQDRPE